MGTLSNSFTSTTGNTYYRDIHLSDRLVVCYQIGKRLDDIFLVGITLFGWHDTKAQIIAQKFWDGFSSKCFSERFAKEQSILMLKDFFMSRAKLLGARISEQQMLSFARAMIDETERKQLA